MAATSTRTGPPGLIVSTRTSEGAADNLIAVNNGEVESGLAQSDVVAAAVKGQGLFKKLGPQSHVRVIASLFSEPVHLVVEDLNICTERCTVEYGNPCQYFCPAAVYEMVDASDTGPSASGTAGAVSDNVGHSGKKELKINFTNCVHCKTCDIMDPYQIITWVPPEGGGGPNYDGM